MGIQLDHVHFENYKGAFHMLIFVVALFRVYVIDRRLCFLEKKLKNK